MGDQYGLVNVRAFGAIGNGVSDDTRTIRAALSAVASGSSLYFPPGTYVVAPTETNGTILPIPGPNIRIYGAGIGQSIIKVKDASLPYGAILSGTSGGTDLTNLEIDHLTFDGNVANNPVANADEMMGGGYRASILAYVGAGKTIHHVEIRNSTAVNDIALNSVAGGISITHCRFVNCGDDPNHVVFDSSSIYIHAYGAIVADNYWQSPGVNTPSARAAIEVHGKSITISGNVIRDYAVGMNVTGVSAVDGTDLAVLGNTIEGAAYGIQLWSVAYGGHVTGYGLDGCVVSGNSIHLAETGVWSLSAGNVVCGIKVEAGITMDIRGLVISGNIVASPLESTPITQDDGAYRSVGIGWHSIQGENVPALYDSVVSGNTIINFPVAGVFFNSNLQNVRITGNTLINTGSTLDPVFAGSGFKAPIYIGPPTFTRGLVIADNYIVDTNDVTRVPAAIWFACATEASGIELLNNTVRLSGGDQSAFLTHVGIVDNHAKPYLRGAFWGFLHTSDPTYEFATGSEVIDPSNGRVYRLAADNKSWIYQPLLATGAGKTVDDVIAALQLRGIVRQT